MLTVKYINPEVSKHAEKTVKVKTSGHRTRAFIDALKRELILDSNERFLKKQAK